MPLTQDEQLELDYLMGDEPINMLNPDEQAELDYLLASDPPEPAMSIQQDRPPLQPGIGNSYGTSQHEPNLPNTQGSIDNMYGSRFYHPSQQQGHQSGLTQQILSQDYNAPNPPPFEMLSNAPGSAKNYAEDTINMVMHPLDAAEQFLNLFTDKNAQAQAKEHYLGRYGSMDKFGESIVNDPVGTLADLSMVMSPLSLAKQGSSLSKIGKLGTQLDPISLTAKGAGKTIGAVGSSKLPNKLMEIAFKPNTGLIGAPHSAKQPLYSNENISNYLLDNNISITHQGLKKLGKTEGPSKIYGLARADVHNTMVNQMAYRLSHPEAVFSTGNIASGITGGILGELLGTGVVPGVAVAELMARPSNVSRAANLLHKGRDLGNKGPLLKPPTKTMLDLMRELEEQQ